jgi:oxysterol-binding protein 1
LRPDVRLWEEGKQEEASDAKNKLEDSQRQRKKKLKEVLGDKIEPENDSSYYTPKYFKKTKNQLTGDDYYEELGTYWQDRDKLDWKHMPQIYSEHCEPFYK